MGKRGTEREPRPLCFKKSGLIQAFSWKNEARYQTLDWSMTELTSLQNDVFSLLRTVNMERFFPFLIFFSSCNEEASCASSARLFQECFQAIFHAVSYCRTMKEEGFGEDITTVFYWLTTLCIRIKITRSSEKKVPIPCLFFLSLFHWVFLRAINRKSSLWEKPYWLLLVHS